MKLSNFVDNILWRAGLYFPWCLLNLSQYFSTDAVNILNYVKEIKTAMGLECEAADHRALESSEPFMSG